MNNILYRPPKAQHFKDNLPLDGGRVIFYSAGTTTLKAVYSGIDQSTPAPNPHVLDSGGFVQDGGLWLGEGNYKVVVQELIAPLTWSTFYEVDDVAGSDYYNTQTEIVIDNIQDLRDSSATGIAHVLGYYSTSDLGGGLFYWDSTNSVLDDGGAYIEKTGGGLGRWVRIFDKGQILPQYWGAVPNDNALNTTSNFSKMITYAGANGSSIFIPQGVYEIGGDVEFKGSIGVEVAEGAEFDGSGTVYFGDKNSVSFDLDVDLKINGSKKLVTYPNTNMENLCRQDTRPEWWGCIGDGVTDDTTLFSEAVNNTLGKLLIINDFALNTVNIVREMKFDGGSIVVLGGTVTIGDWEGEPSFRGDFSSISFTYRELYKSSWFFVDGVISVVDLDNVFGAIGSVKWLWDTASVFNSAYTQANAEQITSLFQSILTINATVKFGLIDALDEQIFDVASTGTVVNLGGELVVYWFGALSNNVSTANNATAIQNAINSLQQNQWLDFKHGYFTLDTEASPTNNGEIRLKDGIIRGRLNISGSDLYTDNFSCQRSGDVALFTGALETCKINCGEWIGSVSIDCESPFVTGSTFEDVAIGAGQIGGTDSNGVINSNVFKILTVNIAEQTGTEWGARAIMSGNKLNKLVLNGASYFKCTDNYFSLDGDTDQRVTINATYASQTAKSLIIKDNFFDYGASLPTTEMVVLSGAFADFGHYAFIGGNKTNVDGHTINQTRIVGFTPLAGSSFNITKGIFPKSVGGVVRSYGDVGSVLLGGNITSTAGQISLAPFNITQNFDYFSVDFSDTTSPESF